MEPTASSDVHPQTQPPATVSAPPTPVATETAIASASPPAPTPTYEVAGEGVGWTGIRLPGSGNPSEIAAFSAGFLATDIYADSTVFWLSPDGLDWEQPAVGSDLEGGHVGQLTEWNGKLLAAGHRNVGDAVHASFWTSEDGRAWASLPDSAELAFTGFDESLPTSFGLTSLTADGDNIQAVGVVTCHCETDVPLAVMTWTSGDAGQTWHGRQQRKEWPTPDPVQIGENWVRVNQDRTGLDWSPNKRDWEPAWVSETSEAYADLWDVVPTDTGGVAVGVIDDSAGDRTVRSGLALTSGDGVAWTQSTGWPDLEPGFMRSVASSGGVTVAVGVGGDTDGLGNPLEPYAWISSPPQ